MGFSEDRAKGQFGQVYCLVSENPYLLWDASEHWKETWRRTTGTPIPIASFTAPQIDFDLLLGVGATLPMFETLQLVIVHAVHRVHAKRQDEFVRLLGQSAPTTKWLLTAESIDRRTTYYKNLASVASVEIFPKIYPEHIPGWATRIASDLGAQLSPSAIQTIASVYGTDLFALRQAIERAMLYIGQKRRIEAADIETVLTGEGEHDIFRLIESASRHDFESALSIGRGLWAAGDKLQLWLPLIQGQCFRYLRILEMGDMSIQQMAAALTLPPFIISKLRDQAAGFGTEGLTGVMAALFDAARHAHTSSVPAQLGWELLIWRMSGGSERAAKSLFELEHDIHE